METLEKSQNNFTDDEKAIAKHFKLKPELVRIFSKLHSIDMSTPAEDVSFWTKGLSSEKEEE